MNLIDALSGVLHVRPGRVRPHNLLGTRPDWAEPLTRGRTVSAVPGMLASVYSLCGHAHRMCAQLALQAAAGHASERVADLDGGLQLETLREHVRRIGLDWTGSLPVTGSADLDASHRSIQACPALRHGVGVEAVAETRRWLEEGWLGMSASTWLAGWERDPAQWLATWSESTTGWLPRLLLCCRPAADWRLRAARPLRLHGSSHSVRALAARLRDDTAFSRQPTCDATCAETGAWTRLNDTSAHVFDTPWLRLGARLAELTRLVLPDVPACSGGGWLAMGALALGPGEGLAWVEMARGLLIHQVQTDRGAPEARVASYRVLAPTEWNFHPQGAVAQALETLGSGDAELVPHQVAALMAAYDPCVRFEVELQPRPQETAHA